MNGRSTPSSDSANLTCVFTDLSIRREYLGEKIPCVINALFFVPCFGLFPNEVPLYALLPTSMRSRSPRFGANLCFIFRHLLLNATVGAFSCPIATVRAGSCANLRTSPVRHLARSRPPFALFRPTFFPHLSESFRTNPQEPSTVRMVRGQAVDFEGSDCAVRAGGLALIEVHDFPHGAVKRERLWMSVNDKNISDIIRPQFWRAPPIRSYAAGPCPQNVRTRQARSPWSRSPSFEASAGTLDFGLLYEKPSRSLQQLFPA